MDARANHLADSHGLSPPLHGTSTRLHLLAGDLDCFDDVRVTRAAAQVAFQTFANLGFGGARIALQQRLRSQDEAWRAEATLQAVLVPEGFLEGAELTVGGHPFDGHQLLAVCLNGKHGASLDGSIVDE